MGERPEERPQHRGKHRNEPGVGLLSTHIAPPEVAVTMAKSAAGENAWLWCTQRFGQYEMESATELFLNAFFFSTMNAKKREKKKETHSAFWSI